MIAIVGEIALALALAPAVPRGGGDGDVPREWMDPLSRACLFPHRREVSEPEFARLQPATVHFENASGAQLRGLWYENGDSERTILVCMGNTGNATWMVPYAAILVDGGFDVLLFDYQGFGASEGVASLLSLPGDALAAWRYLTDVKGRRPEQIGVLGISLGSVLALTLAADVQPHACAVEDLFLPERELDDFASGADSTAEQLALAGVKTLVLPKVDPRANAARFGGPLFLMHGDSDWLLTPLATLELAQSRPQNTRTWILADTGHSPESLEIDEWEYRDQLAGFFRDAFEAGGSPLDEPGVRFEVIASNDAEHADLPSTGVAPAPVPAPHVPSTRVKVTVTSSEAAALQVTLAGDPPDPRHGHPRFHHERRTVPAGESSFECELEFEPSRATACARAISAIAATAPGNASFRRCRSRSPICTTSSTRSVRRTRREWLATRGELGGRRDEDGAVPGVLERILEAARGRAPRRRRRPSARATALRAPARPGCVCPRRGGLDRFARA